MPQANQRQQLVGLGSSSIGGFIHLNWCVPWILSVRRKPIYGGCYSLLAGGGREADPISKGTQQENQKETDSDLLRDKRAPRARRPKLERMRTWGGALSMPKGFAASPGRGVRVGRGHKGRSNHAICRLSWGVARFFVLDLGCDLERDLGLVFCRALFFLGVRLGPEG